MSNYIVNKSTYDTTFDVRGGFVGTGSTLLEFRNRARFKSHINYLQQCLVDRLLGKDADDINELIDAGIDRLRTDLKAILPNINVKLRPIEARVSDPEDGTENVPGRFWTLRVTLSNEVEQYTESFDISFKVFLVEDDSPRLTITWEDDPSSPITDLVKRWAADCQPIPPQQ